MLPNCSDNDAVIPYDHLLDPEKLDNRCYDLLSATDVANRINDTYRDQPSPTLLVWKVENTGWASLRHEDPDDGYYTFAVYVIDENTLKPDQWAIACPEDFRQALAEWEKRGY